MKSQPLLPIRPIKPYECEMPTPCPRAVEEEAVVDVIASLFVLAVVSGIVWWVMR